MKPFREHIEHRFEVEGEEIAAGQLQYDGGITFVEVEEVRKNGQEDTHMRGVLVLAGRCWKWDTYEGEDDENFSFYHSQRLANSIPAYLNKHRHPEEG